jgi:hypothetical protein
MAEPKTRPTSEPVSGYLKKITEADRRADCAELVKMFASVVRKDGVMWGTDIVGFGTYTMTYADGREMDWPLTGFSPRKGSLVLYVPGARKLSAAALKKIGKCKVSGGCMHINKLADVDIKKLKAVVAAGVKAKRGATR